MGYSIVTLDEAGFYLVPTYRKVWYLKGENPKGIFFWSNKKISICGALVDGKKLHYEWYDSLNSLTYKSFLSGLEEALSKKKRYVFVLDNAPYHKSSVILNYLNKLKNVTVEFLPKYSPELNPTETCWKIIRSNVMLNLSNYLCR